MAGPGDRGEADGQALSAAVDFLRDRLGGLFFEGTDRTSDSDIAFANLLRLRALWELSGEQPANLLISRSGGETVTVHDAMMATGDDRLREAVGNLFGTRNADGHPAEVGQLPRGEVGVGDGRGSTATMVDLAKGHLERQAEESGASLTDLRLSAPPSSSGGSQLPGPGDRGMDDVDVAARREEIAKDLLADAAANEQADGDGGGGGQPPVGDGVDTPWAGDAPGDGTADGTAGGTMGAGLNQYPQGAETWQVGNDYYLKYQVPGTNLPLVWKVNEGTAEEVFGTPSPSVDRTLTEAEFKGLSPWQGGLTSELAALPDRDPWEVFLSEFDKAAELRPWLDDPTVVAVMAGAYLEGREPTRDELSTTDWWNEHTADERAWMEQSATAGTAEVERLHNDARSEVSEALRQAGMDNAHDHVIDYIAEQRLTGAWSEAETSRQLRKLTDPYAPGKLDDGLLAALRAPEWVTGGDARAISKGRDAVRQRLDDLWSNRGIAPGVNGESRDEAIERLTAAVMNGERTLDDIRRSADLWAARSPTGRPGGLDVTAEQEDRVRALAARWLGPQIGQMGEEQVAEWAGKLRNNPDAEQEFIESLRQQRLAMLPGYTNENLTYEDIVSPVRNLAQQTWGRPMTDETLLVDLANTMDYTEMAKRLRKRGRQEGVPKVVLDSLSGQMGTPLGQRVQRSTI